MSREHAQLAVSRARVTVRDLDSRNGTFVDGERVRFATLHVGETLRLGSLSFILSEKRPAGSGLESGHETQSVHGPSDLLTQQEDLRALSKAHGRVVHLLLEGLSDREIADRLGIARNTVHNHLREIYRKFGVHSRAELIARLLRKSGDGLTQI